MKEVVVLMSIKDNFSDYLEKSIDSILSQSYKDFEFVIIADGSNDKTLDILKYYEKNDKRIKLIINKKNIGLAKSLNKGIVFANSEYIIRQDYDDISHYRRIEFLINYVKRKNLKLALSDCIKIDLKGEKIGYININNSINYHRKKIEYMNTFVHPSIIIKKDLLVDYGMYNESLICSQDYELWEKIIKFHSFGVLKKKLLSLRIHNSSISVLKSKKQREYSFYIGAKVRFPNLANQINSHINDKPIDFIDKINSKNRIFLSYMQARYFVYIFDEISSFNFFKLNYLAKYYIIILYINRPTYLVRRLLNYN